MTLQSSRHCFLGGTQSQHDCQLTHTCLRKANISPYRLMLQSRPVRLTASSPKTAAKDAHKWRMTETCLLFYVLCNRTIAAYRLEKKTFCAQQPLALFNSHNLRHRPQKSWSALYRCDRQKAIVIAKTSRYGTASPWKGRNRSTALTKLAVAVRCSAW